MANTMYSIDSAEPFESAMLMRKDYIPEVTMIIYSDTQGDLVSPRKYNRYNPLAEFKDTVNDNVDESFEYARYWHGYSLILRPLFLIFNVTQIRILLKIVFVILSTILLCLIAAKFDVKIMFMYLISLISVEYFYIGDSLQGTSVFLITMVFSIIMLLKNGKFKHIGLTFFIVRDGNKLF